MVQAVEAYRSVSASDELRELERQRDRTRRNEASALAHARREAKLEMAKSMIADGISVDVVSKHSGLTVDEVLKL